jgi:hypothetical protein
MKIDLANSIPIMIGLVTLAGYIWQAAELKANISAKISSLESELKADISAKVAGLESKTIIAVDLLKDELIKEILQNKHKIDLHLVEWNEKKEVYAYRFGSLESLIKHKFDRLANWIKQIANFLNKQSNFQTRDDEY